MQKKKFVREHPIKIFIYMAKFFWILIIPLIRGLFSLKGDLISWAKGSWIDIFSISFIILFGFLRWKNCFYLFENNYVKCFRGIFIKKIYSVPYYKITSFCISKNIILKHLNALNLDINTNASSKKKADISLLFPRKSISIFLDKNKSEACFDENNDVNIHPKNIYLLAFSLFFSNTLSGAILVITILLQIRSFIISQPAQKIFDEFFSVGVTLSQNFSLAILTISAIVVCTWLISFVRNILKYQKFSILKKSNQIKIKSGIFTNKTHQLNALKVNYLYLRQNLPAKFFKMASIYVNCTGYGNKKGENPLLLPITYKANCLSLSRILLPEIFNDVNNKADKMDFFSFHNIILQPKKSEIKRFIFLPMLIFALIFIFAFILQIFLIYFKPLVIFIAIISEIPIIWLLFVKIIAFYTTSIKFVENTYILSYSRFYYFETVLIKSENIVKVRISSTPFQRRSGLCTVTFYTKSKKEYKHILKHLDYKNTLDFVKKINNFQKK